MSEGVIENYFIYGIGSYSDGRATIYLAKSRNPLVTVEIHVGPEVEFDEQPRLFQKATVRFDMRGEVTECVIGNTCIKQ